MRRLLTNLVSVALAMASLTFAPFCLLLGCMAFIDRIADDGVEFNRQAGTILFGYALATFLITALWFWRIRPWILALGKDS